MRAVRRYFDEKQNLLELSVAIHPGDRFTYTLVSGTGSTDNAKFTIAGNQLKAAASFDFEKKKTYTIRVRVTDAAGLSFEKTFTINVTNGPG